MATDIGTWLDGLGLAQYADVFRRNDVDLSVLPALTVDDLKDLGVRSIGHRRTLLNAIAALERADQAPVARRSAEAERKVVTVLFADVQDSTLTTQAMDAEEAAARLAPAVEAMADAVHRYGGTVNKVLGDGVMALFGAPVAFEDHAQRACLAALAIRQASLTGGWPVRVGLHAGEVVVGASATDFGHDYDAHGPTVHLAARMEQMAEPGSILITGTVAALAEGFIESSSLGAQTVKGVAEPVDVHSLIGDTGAASRWQARLARRLTPLAGRDAELALMRSSLDLAGPGHGQVIALIGEPGIGKSRLAHEFALQAEAGGWQVLRTGTQAHGAAVPFLPFRSFLGAWAGIADDRPPADRRRALTDALAGLAITDGHAVAAAAALMNLPLEEAERDQTGESRRRAIQSLLQAAVLRLATQRRLVLLIEDLHWIDEASRETIEGIVQAMAGVPLVLLLTGRPGCEMPGTGQSYATTLRLQPLAEPSVDKLLDGLLGGDLSLAKVKTQIRDNTAGTPLFVEELVRALVDSGALQGTPGEYRARTDAELGGIPATVEAVLAARIDLLSPEDKSLLQQAAVIGRSVPRALLAHLADTTDAVLDERLGRLRQQDFLHPDMTADEPRYQFKHALTQDVAYGQLLRRRRRDLHSEVAACIERLHHNNLAPYAADLARHAFAAEQWQVAANRYDKLARQYFVDSLVDAAVEAGETAIRALDNCPRTLGVHRQTVGLLMFVGTIVFRPGDLDEARQARNVTRAVAEAKLSEDRDILVLAYAIQAQTNFTGVRLDRVVENARQAVDCCDADTALDVRLRAVGNYAAALEQRGRIRDILEHCAPVFVAHRAEMTAAFLGHEARFLPPFGGTLVAYASCGEFAAARWLYDLNFQVREITRNATNKLWTLMIQSSHDLILGDFEAGERYAAAAVDLALSRDISVVLRDVSLTNLITARAALGDGVGAGKALECLGAQARSGVRYGLIHDVLFAQAAAVVANLNGRYGEAEALCRRAIDGAEAIGYGGRLPELAKLRYRNLVDMGDVAAAGATAAAYDAAWKFLSAQDLKPSLGQLRFAFARHCVQTGQADAAAQAFADALSIFEGCGMQAWVARVRAYH